MKVFISSYAAYNTGNLVGQWYDLDDYADHHELLDAATDYLNEKLPDINHEELMCQDWEDTPDYFVQESLSASEWADLFELVQMDDPDVVIGWLNATGQFDIMGAQDAYAGHARNEDEYHESLYDFWCEIAELPQHIPEWYLDKDAIGRDMAQDYVHDEETGNFYRNY